MFVLDSDYKFLIYYVNVLEQLYIEMIRYFLYPISNHLMIITWPSPSRDVNAPGVLITVFNKRTSKMLKKYMDYVLITQFELSLLEKMVSDAAKISGTVLPVTSTPLQIVQCVTGYREPHEVVFRSLKFKLLTNLLTVVAYCMLGAVFALLLELVIHKFFKWLHG